jgi:hypothetical protein
MALFEDARSEEHLLEIGVARFEPFVAADRSRPDSTSDRYSSGGRTFHHRRFPRYECPPAPRPR